MEKLHKLEKLTVVKCFTKIFRSLPFQMLMVQNTTIFIKKTMSWVSKFFRGAIILIDISTWQHLVIHIFEYREQTFFFEKNCIMMLLYRFLLKLEFKTQDEWFSFGCIGGNNIVKITFMNFIYTSIFS